MCSEGARLKAMEELAKDVVTEEAGREIEEVTFSGGEPEVDGGGVEEAVEDTGVESSWRRSEEYGTHGCGWKHGKRGRD